MKLRNKFITSFISIVILSFLAVYFYTQTSIGWQKEKYPLGYSQIVEKYSEIYSVEPEIIYATIWCESRFDPKAVSPKGACGLMQIMPETFEWLGQKLSEDTSQVDIFDPDVNIKYGTFLLSLLYDQFKNPDTAHAAYNAGIGRVRQWLENSEYYKDGKLYNIPYPETRNYVKKIITTTAKYRNIMEADKNE